MVTNRIEEWHFVDAEDAYVRRSSSGVLYRRLAPPPPPGIYSQDFSSLSPMATLASNPAGVNAYRTVSGDPSYGYNSTEHGYMSLVDEGGAEGMAFVVTYDDHYRQSSLHNGIAYLPKLSRQVDAVTLKQRVKFSPGFLSGKGIKFGFGVGWKNAWVDSPSTGGTSNDHAGSFRFMLRDDFRLSPYLYDANGTAGLGIATTPTLIQTLSDGDYHDLEFDLILNTASVEAGPKVTGGTPPSPGALGTDYLADGGMVCRLDGVEFLNRSDRVHRKYADTVHTHQTHSFFRGGGDDSWDVVSGGVPQKVYITSYSVEEKL